jgi:S-adenosylmethionine decarboxylase
MEWLVEAYGCEPARLCDKLLLEEIFNRCVNEMRLKPVQPAQWHVFPSPGGITGMLLLAESHLTIHTFPETGFAALNLYCCRKRAAWEFETRLREALRATRVNVRELSRE